MTIQNLNNKSFLQTKCGWVNVRDGTHTKAFEMNYKVTEMKKMDAFVNMKYSRYTFYALTPGKAE